MTSTRQVAIALVGPLPPPSGGMANQTRQLARLLDEAGFAVEVVQVNRPLRPEWLERLRWLRAGLRLIPYAIRLWRCSGRADVMHVMANSGWAWHLFAAPAIWIAHTRGVPVIVNYRGGEADAFLARRSASVRVTMGRAFAVIVPSRFLEAVFRRHGIATQIVPNIIDLSRFRPDPARPPGHHLIVTRNLEDLYDIGTALRAFAQVWHTFPDATLTIAGSGPRLADLQRLAAELGVASRVRFTGRLDNERIAELYRQADLVLNPSTADNMPISLLEGMASGVPIVSTDVGGIPFLVESGVTALLVPPRDPARMASAALDVLSRPELARQLRNAGIDLAARFAWTEVRPLLFAVYAKAIGVDSLRACSA
jgi:glycosyltransferase involved in cell wall biosynthesis